MADTGFVAILRHGAYEQRSGAPSARQPFALTSQGKAQARAGTLALAEMIAAHNLTVGPVIHASRQLRAWQTASEILITLQDCGIGVERITETSDLAERGVGSAANLTLAEIEAVLRDDPRYGPPPAGWKSDSDYCLPLEGAESLMQAGARVAGHLQSTVTPGQLTIHVGHGASFRHAFHHLGVLAREDIARLSMFHAQPLLFCHGPHGNWRHLTGEWKVRAPKEEAMD